MKNTGKVNCYLVEIIMKIFDDLNLSDWKSLFEQNYISIFFVLIKALLDYSTLRYSNSKEIFSGENHQMNQNCSANKVIIC